MKKEVSLSKEEITVMIIKMALEELKKDPSIRGKKLMDIFLSRSEELPFPVSKDIKTWEGYSAVVTLFYRLWVLLEAKKVKGTEKWSNEDFERVVNTGKRLCRVRRGMMELSDEQFIEMFDMILAELKTKKVRREPLKNLCRAKLKTFGVTEYYDELHEIWKRKVAVPFIVSHFSCVPMTKVILDDDRSLKIDLIGWCTETGKIIGVEVKRSINDFTKKKKCNSELLTIL